MSKPDQEYWKSLLMKLQYFEEEIRIEDKKLATNPSLDILKEIIREQMKDEDSMPATRSVG